MEVRDKLAAIIGRAAHSCGVKISHNYAAAPAGKVNLKVEPSLLLADELLKSMGKALHFDNLVPPKGAIELVEYIGFEYAVFVTQDGFQLEPSPNQHRNASLDKHIRAATSAYLTHRMGGMTGREIT